MQNNNLHVDLPISYTGNDQDAVSFQFNDKVEHETKLERVKRKTTQQAMLNSLFDSDTGESHEHSSELMELIQKEYQSNMVEISSGNGQSVNIWNDETKSYDVYLSADGNESSEHSRNGLSDSLIDGYEGIHDKNASEIPTYTVINDDEGNPLRIDDMACMVTVSDSNYSIWDTIHDKGQLIVRHLSNWYGIGCQFKKQGYTKREALRLTKKHNRLMGYTDLNVQREAQSEIAVKRLSSDCKGNRQLTRLTKEARRGKQWAQDALAKIGYNDFAINN